MLVCVCLYIYIIHIHSTHTLLCKQKLLFWMWLIVIYQFDSTNCIILYLYLCSESKELLRLSLNKAQECSSEQLKMASRVGLYYPMVTEWQTYSVGQLVFFHNRGHTPVNRLDVNERGRPNGAARGSWWQMGPLARTLILLRTAWGIGF